MKSTVTLALLFAATAALAQPQRRELPAQAAQPPAPPMSCTAIRDDGRESQPGFNFLSVHEGRVTLLLTRSADGHSTVVDFLPVPNRPGVSFVIENFDVRPGERPISLFMLASIGQDGLIAMERWQRTGQGLPEYTHHRLRCTR